MEFLNLLWIFLALALIIPVIRKNMLNGARLRLLHHLEQKRGTRVIALIHRHESMSILGFPITRFIDIQDSEEVLRAIKLTDPNIPIDIILHTPGGLALASEQIARALSKHPSKVSVFIPHYAMSGGTMISLAADEIIMDPNAVLGPLDPQIGQFPAVSILNVLEKKDLNKVDDETLILADIARKAISQVKSTIRLIACCHYTKDEAEYLANEMVSGKWTHDYPINVEEAQQLGMKISIGMPTEIYSLMNLYPQTNQQRPSVEFIPSPYTKRPKLPGGDQK